MKLHSEEERTVIKHGAGEETTFKINGSAKAFRILSDKMYSDKVRAVIRELAANAKDAMIDAGKGDVPFEIHLPNRLEPWFAVKDYGIGLCHEDVMSLYSTYFESTKTDSNDVTGCLGLGSKSPFAYVDSFTVEARWEGVRTLYSCFYNEQGIPTITVLADQMETDEPNGLEIKMPVKEDDMHEFATKAAKELRRFDPQPIVTGNTDYGIESIEYWVEGSKWKMMKGENRYSYGEGTIHAIQGNVTYPVNVRSLTGLTDKQSMVTSGMYIDLFFNIGELDVAPSREALSYDEATIDAIKKRLGVVAKELPPLFQDKFTDCKTLWEARILFNEMVSKVPHGVRGLLSDSDVGLKWKGQTLGEKFAIVKEKINVDVILFQLGYKGNRGSKQDYSYKGDMKFDASPNITFFYDDLGHGSHSRMTYFLEDGTDAKSYNYLFKTDNKKELKKISKALGNVKLQPVSNLPKRPKAERAAVRVTSKVLEYTGTAYDRRDSWKPTELDLSTGGIFVMINRYNVYDRIDPKSDWCELDGEFNSIVELAKDNGIIDLTDETIYGIRKGDVAKLKDDSGWVNLFDKLRGSLKDVIAKEKIAKKLANSDEYGKFDFALTNYETELNEHKFAKTSLLKEFMDIYKYMDEQRTERSNSIRTVAKRINYPIKDATPKYDLDKLWDGVKEVYPLIALLDHSKMRGGYYSYSTDKEQAKKNIESVMSYIDGVDMVRASIEEKEAA